MVIKEGLTWGGQHTVQYTDDVLQNCILETYIILLTNVTPGNSIKIEKNTIKIHLTFHLISICKK